MIKSDGSRASIGRRLKLRDLHVFLAVVEHGSMAKAAAQLRVTQPAVSQVILDLEHSLGVRLLDRSPRGTEPTAFGLALVKGGRVAFDDLAQTIKEIEFLANPTVGEVHVGCPETVAAILHPIIHRLSSAYPGIVVHIVDVVAPTLELPALLNREIDVALLRTAKPPKDMKISDDLLVEMLFNDEACIVAGSASPWAARSEMRVADLTTAKWVLPPRGSLNRSMVSDAFRAAGLPEPTVMAETFSMQLRVNLLADGQCLTVLPKSVMVAYGKRDSISILPIRLPQTDWPVVMVTLKGRTLNPVTALFMEAVRTGLGTITNKTK